MPDVRTFVSKRHRQLGRRARERAQARAGGGRIPDSAWAPEIDWLVELGLTTPQIAAAVNLSERRVREIKQYASEEGVVVIPDYIPKSELPEDVQEMLEFTADGFEKFYNRFSGYTLPAHCKPWVDAFTKERNLMINIPPRHMKSTIFSLWIPVWLLCRDRNERILLVSMTKEFAKQWVMGIAEQLSVNDDIVRTFGRFKPHRSGDSAWRPLSGTLMVSGRPQTAGVQYSVESRGSRQQVLGKEATVVIVDDVTNKERAENELMRQKELDWLQGEVFSRVETQTTESSGRAVVVAQRISVHDLYGALESQVYERGPKEGEPLWRVIKEPAVRRWPDEDPANPEPVVLWPEKWPFEELMVTYERVGGHATFSAMYQQQPIPEGHGVFMPDWWVRCRDYDRPAGKGVRLSKDQAFLPVSRVLSIDPSVRQFHGLVVADVLYDARRFVPVIIEVKRWKGTQRSILSEIDRCIRQYKPDYFIFEDVSFIQWLKEDPYFQELKERVRVIPHQTGRNKGDPDMGIESLAREVEFGQIRLPYEDEAGRAMSALLESEANAYPYGKTTDVLMALWFIKWNYKRLIPTGLFDDQMKWMPESANKVWAGFERLGRTHA